MFRLEHLFIAFLFGVVVYRFCLVIPHQQIWIDNATRVRTKALFEGSGTISGDFPPKVRHRYSSTIFRHKCLLPVSASTVTFPAGHIHNIKRVISQHHEDWSLHTPKFVFVIVDFVVTVVLLDHPLTRAHLLG